MKTIRTLIVDDEPLARERVRKLLEMEEGFEIIGECEDGAKAVAAIEEDRPDLVFLDVQMPECDGFEVLLSLDRDRLPAVIFVTAYDQYAVRAFDVHALDYLLKPFDRERFQEALDRARAQLAQAGAEPVRDRLTALLDEMGTRQKQKDRILVKTGGKVLFLDSGEIDWVEAAGNYLQLHTASDTYLMRETMGHMETKLDPRRFLRIHRSAIVNFERIKEMESSFNGEYTVVLHDGTTLKLSRKYRAAFEQRLGRPL